MYRELEQKRRKEIDEIEEFDDASSISSIASNSLFPSHPEPLPYLPFFYLLSLINSLSAFTKTKEHLDIFPGTNFQWDNGCASLLCLGLQLIYLRRTKK